MVSPLVLPPPQPCSNVTAAKNTMSWQTTSRVGIKFPRLSVRFAIVACGVRGRMQCGMQAKGQRKDETSLDCESNDMSSDYPSLSLKMNQLNSVPGIAQDFAATQGR